MKKITQLRTCEKTLIVYFMYNLLQSYIPRLKVLNFCHDESACVLSK
jgi:hypothetical protein